MTPRHRGVAQCWKWGGGKAPARRHVGPQPQPGDQLVDAGLTSSTHRPPQRYGLTENNTNMNTNTDVVNGININTNITTNTL